MRKKFLFLFIFLFLSTNVFAEYRLEPVNCTIKKKITVVLIFIIVKQVLHIFVIQQNVQRYWKH